MQRGKVIFIEKYDVYFILDFAPPIQIFLFFYFLVCDHS